MYFSYFRHPLFPLLSTLFEKCEFATKSIELSTVYNFNSDAQSFIEQKIKDKKEIACEDDEVNELVSYHQIEIDFCLLFENAAPQIYLIIPFFRYR